MTDSSPRREIVNDTAINVVGLLQSEIGDHRDYGFVLDALPLGDNLVARGIDGEIRLTRLRDRILGAMTATARVDLECVRCLRTYGQPVEMEFAEEYWQTVEVRTGFAFDPEEGVDDLEERFLIDESHELDLREALRQHIVLALPMKPDCGEACPGPPRISDDNDPSIDNRFAVLANLLDGPSNER